MASDRLVILDTGPLIAYFDRKDPRHPWAKSTAVALRPPFVTTESVLSETCFLLERQKLPIAPLFEMLSSGAIAVEFSFQMERPRLQALMESYADQPMSLADATLVRLAEIHENAAIFTIDHHFRIYRKHGRRQIPLIIPDSIR